MHDLIVCSLYRWNNWSLDTASYFSVPSCGETQTDSFHCSICWTPTYWVSEHWEWSHEYNSPPSPVLNAGLLFCRYRLFVTQASLKDHFTTDLLKGPDAKPTLLSLHCSPNPRPKPQQGYSTVHSQDEHFCKFLLLNSSFSNLWVHIGCTKLTLTPVVLCKNWILPLEHNCRAKNAIGWWWMLNYSCLCWLTGICRTICTRIVLWYKSTLLRRLVQA